MRDILTCLLMLAGASFMLLAAIGVLRLPDLFTRMHAATKSGTLGVSGMILALAVHFGDLDIAIQSIMVVVFLYLTAPVSAHVVARAAYRVGVPLWQNSVADEMKGRYDPETGVLASYTPPEKQD